MLILNPEITAFLADKGYLVKILSNRSSASAYANQLPGFSLRGTSIPNELFQIITGLKKLVSYSKRLH